LNGISARNGSSRCGWRNTKTGKKNSPPAYLNAMPKLQFDPCVPTRGMIVEAALKNRVTSFVIDGEAVLLGVDGISDFNGLHSRQNDEEVQSTGAGSGDI
jgi:hypothetical protein